MWIAFSSSPILLLQIFPGDETRHEVERYSVERPEKPPLHFQKTSIRNEMQTHAKSRKNILVHRKRVEWYNPYTVLY
jgi:hypothetical protein